MKRLSLFFALLFTAVTLLADSVTPTATLELVADSPNTGTDGGQLTFTASATDYPANTTALAWSITVPAGWSYQSGTGEPTVAPASGTTILLEWAYVDIPETTATFTFTVSYPADILEGTEVTAEVFVRTDDTPTATTLPVDAVAFTPVPTRGNDITFPAIADKQANAPSFTLAATSPSGLPITYTVVSGPALINGNEVTLTGALGEVVIRAAQGGDLYFLPADAVTQSFTVLQSGNLVYFGTAPDGTPFAMNIPPGQGVDSPGQLITQIPNGQFAILVFRVVDGTLVPLALQVVGTPNTSATALAETPIRALSTQVSPTELEYTFTGTISNGQVIINIAEFGLTLTGAVEPATGPTADLAGLYEANSLNSASGTTTSIVGTTGKVYVLAVTPDIIASGEGTVDGNGSFNVDAGNQVTINGAVDQVTTTVSGTIVLPGGEEDAFAGLSTSTLRTDRMINLSTRARVDSATGGALVTGFVIGGSTPKHVLLRAVGPALSDFGVSTALADPRLTLYDGTGAIVAQVDDWGGSANLEAAHNLVGAFPLDAASKDASHLITLQPGAYTMQVDNNGAPGVAIAEIYDASENPNSEYQRLVNISSRGKVSGQEGVLVGGFIVTGNSPKRVVIRGIGPELTTYGVPNPLADPRLQLYNAEQELIARNDNWATPDPVFTGQTLASAAEIETASQTVGAFALPAGSQDAALVLTLAPGAYTVHLDSTTEANTGNALIEIYEIPDESTQ